MIRVRFPIPEPLNLFPRVVFPWTNAFFAISPVGQAYGDEGYPIPSEDEYYQQEPGGSGSGNGGNGDAAAKGSNGHASSSSSHRRRRERHPSSDSQKKMKPLPKESSFFIFSSKNRCVCQGREIQIGTLFQTTTAGSSSRKRTTRTRCGG